MFLGLKNFPILDRVAKSERRVKIQFTEQELFAMTALLATARDCASDLRTANVTQDLINHICERLGELNPGFLESLTAAQRITVQRNRDYAQEIKQRLQKRDRQASHRNPPF